MKPFEEWPVVLNVIDLAKCLEIPRDDAYHLFAKPGFPLLISGKRRGRTVSKGDLWNYLNVGSKV